MSQRTKGYRDVLLLAACVVVSLSAVTCGGGASSSPTGADGTPGKPTYGPGSSSSSGATANVIITINGMDGSSSFTPSNASVKAGQTVAWKNGDVITHEIAQDGGAFTTSAIAGGGTSAPVTVTAPGMLTYHCVIHPSMTGALTVN